MNNYKCKSCGAPLVFDAATGKVHCEFCGSSYDPQAFILEENAVVESSETDETEQWGVKEGMQVYSCPSCGAELICDGTTAATRCPYCGNNAILPGQFSGTLQPQFILPFKVTKEQAVAALQEHYRGKALLPDAFRDKNHIEEVQGIYVPFWLFDREAEGNIQFEGLNSETYRSGDYLITDTRHYKISRAGSMAFQKVPVDGSTRMPDDYMDSVEPYDYRDLKPFNTAYMPGFLADKYDVEQDQAAERAELRCQNSMEEALKNTISGYTAVNVAQKDISLKDQGCHYALLPVWTLATRWKNQTYLFAVNGQTGKMVGNLPMDKGKFHKIFWGITLGGGLLLSLLLSGPIGTLLANL